MVTANVTLSKTAYTAVTTAATNFYLRNNNARAVKISLGTSLPAVGADGFLLEYGETLTHLQVTTGVVYALDLGQTPTISVSEPAP